MLGRDFHVVNFEYDEEGGGDNPYADGDWVESDESPLTVPATIDFGTQDETGGDGSGANVERDAVIYLQKDSAPVHPGTDDESRATEFVDLETGARYRAVSVEHQLHLTAVHVEEL
ncbi:hypothetical protein AArcSl_1284 [Halalkaliarchaeum desulfuricum]|uniref:Uncharacterized protein n=2 Tax=Halalkaliarchaeum desulfuricum TaxID=2055893 RepID=A0A343TIJ3_9EURY|nr:hypothetical protein AArcSl_1284 [Halalkaliarchaeum desulfuricum]